ncbi:hypothetical protein ACHAXA_009714 [Cyclostephanos tholiformis]|uniref:Uncharacterized protein n=1 Tax=Cyclostephanos tholiformis TaxID=382380 RepID=A0ABD3RV40_9STRA
MTTTMTTMTTTTTIGRDDCESPSEDREGDDDEDGGGACVNLRVPPDAEAGVDYLSFQYGGVGMEVLVPVGSEPGDVLRIRIGTGVGDDADEDEDDVDDVARGRGADCGGYGHGPTGRKSLALVDELGGTDVPPLSYRAETRGPIDPSLSSSNGGNGSDGSMQNHDEITRSNRAGGVDGAHHTTVILGDGTIGGQISLHLIESIDDETSPTNRCIDGEGDGTHGVVWASGKLLAQALTSTFGLGFLRKSLLPPRASDNEHATTPFRLNCLEIGSGSGVCGMALAHALNSCKTTKNEGCKGGAVDATILLTDRGGRAVYLLRRNIQRNLPTLLGYDDAYDYRITIAAESLVWGNELQSTTTKFHLIIGSDLLYNTEESYDPLVNTIKRHLCHQRGIVMLAVRWRKPDLEREFFRKAEREGLRFEIWGDLANDDDFGGRRCPCRLNWMEYGDPESDKSNGYFHERTISVAGTEMSLGRVTEGDMESMNDGEYSTFEELQVQVYIGKYHVNDGTTRLQKRQRKNG